jgi:uncharacterized membrane protein YgcG
MLRCKICGFEAKQQTVMVNHVRERHEDSEERTSENLFAQTILSCDVEPDTSYASINNDVSGGGGDFGGGGASGDFGGDD